MARGQEAVTNQKDIISEFAEERGLPVELLLEHGFHIVEEGEHEGWLGIPYITWMGHHYYTRVRNMWGGKPKYMDVHGAEPHLYNPRGAGPGSRVVFICEGELDALTLCHLGYDAVAMAGADKFSHVFFQQLVPLLFDGAKVVIAVDNDTAGQTAVAAISKAFPSAAIMSVPEAHGKDIGDWYLDDRDGLEKALERFAA